MVQTALQNHKALDLFTVDKEGIFMMLAKKAATTLICLAWWRPGLSHPRNWGMTSDSVTNPLLYYSGGSPPLLPCSTVFWDQSFTYVYFFKSVAFSTSSKNGFTRSPWWQLTKCSYTHLPFNTSPPMPSSPFPHHSTPTGAHIPKKSGMFFWIL